MKIEMILKLIDFFMNHGLDPSQRKTSTKSRNQEFGSQANLLTYI